MIYDVSANELDDVNDAIAELERMQSMYCTWGGSGWAMWFGPDQDIANAPLRLDTHPEGGASVRWRPDSTFLAIVESARADMEVCTSSYTPHSLVPAAMVRATLASAKAVLAEYLETRTKPGGVWLPAPVPEYDLTYDEHDETVPVVADTAVLAALDTALGAGGHHAGERFLAEHGLGAPEGHGWQLVTRYPPGSRVGELVWNRTVYTYPDATVRYAPERAPVAVYHQRAVGS